MAMPFPLHSTITIRNIARSDGTVTMAIPGIVIQDDADVLALYVPPGTTAKENYAVPQDARVAAVGTALPSRQRPHVDRTWQTASIRLYLPGQAFSVWLFFDEAGVHTTWYGNLEAPFIGTPIGIDTQDYGLNVVAYPDGRWHWKDEAEFARRLALGFDTASHQAAVRAAGKEFIGRFQQRTAPFNGGWKHWQPPVDWKPPALTTDWNRNFGTHKCFGLSATKN